MFKPYSRYIIGIVALIVALLIFNYLGKILIYLAISAVLALIGRPMVKLYKKISISRFKMPDGVAALLTLLSFFCFIWLLISLFVPVIIVQANLIANTDWHKLEMLIQPMVDKVDRFLMSNNLQKDHESVIDSLMAYFNSYLNLQKTSGLISSVFSFTGQIISAIFAVCFITFFFLKDQNLINDTILLLIPPDYEGKTRTILTDCKRMLSSYFIGLLFDVLAVAVLFSIGMNIIGVHNTVIIGVFAGLMNIIPYVGPILGILFAIIVGLTSNPSINLATEALPLISEIIFVGIIVQLIDMIVVQPYIFSNSVKAHPLEIFLVILSAATLGGVPAMIVAIPVYTVFRLIAKQFLSEFRLVKKLTEDI